MQDDWSSLRKEVAVDLEAPEVELGIGSAGEYEFIPPKLTTAQIRLRRPNKAATGFLKGL